MGNLQIRFEKNFSKLNLKLSRSLVKFQENLDKILEKFEK